MSCWPIEGFTFRSSICLWDRLQHPLQDPERQGEVETAHQECLQNMWLFAIVPAFLDLMKQQCQNTAYIGGVSSLALRNGLLLNPKEKPPQVKNRAMLCMRCSREGRNVCIGETNKQTNKQKSLQAHGSTRRNQLLCTGSSCSPSLSIQDSNVKVLARVGDGSHLLDSAAHPPQTGKHPLTPGCKNITLSSVM